MFQIVQSLKRKSDVDDELSHDAIAIVRQIVCYNYVLL